MIRYVTPHQMITYDILRPVNEAIVRYNIRGIQEYESIVDYMNMVIDIINEDEEALLTQPYNEYWTAEFLKTIGYFERGEGNK